MQLLACLPAPRSAPSRQRHTISLILFTGAVAIGFNISRVRARIDAAATAYCRGYAMRFRTTLVAPCAGD